jgi:hypothetical protein
MVTNGAGIPFIILIVGGARAKERGYRYIPGGEELEPPFKERRGK